MAKKDELSKVSKNQKAKQDQSSGSKDGSSKKKDKCHKVYILLWTNNNIKTNLKVKSNIINLNLSLSFILNLIRNFLNQTQILAFIYAGFWPST